MSVPAALVSIYHSSNIHETVHTDEKGLLRPVNSLLPDKNSLRHFYGKYEEHFLQNSMCVCVDL